MASLWLAETALVLASGSAVRRQMLEDAGIPVEVCPADIDERAVEQPLRAAGATPDAIAVHLAAAKAAAVAATHPGRLVLGADQTLSLDRDLFAKPPTVEAARDHLCRLAGRTHQLHAGACLRRDDHVLFQGCLEATLEMRRLSEAFLDRYLAIEGEALCASVGAYRLEGLGINLFETIDGDHRTILGLPLLALLPALRQHGYLLG
jgi:septum formation protein